MRATSSALLIILSLFSTGAVESKTIYVSPGGTGDGTSWVSPVGTITGAINLTNTDDQIWVKGGEYRELLRIQTAVIHLYGGFSGTETALEERDWRTNKTIVNGAGKKKTVVIITKNITFDGFLITGGTTGAGTGISLQGCSPTIRNCSLYGNISEKGGGFYISEAAGVISDCTIMNNTAEYYGGGIFLSASKTTFKRCHLFNNRAKDGAGIYSDDSTSALQQSRIVDNDARETGGGAYLIGSNLTISNCVVHNNAALNAGGGLYLFGSEPHITNCVLINNHTYGLSGAIYSNYSISTVRNCILWNPGEETLLYSTIDGSINISYSCIQGGYPGTGNINAPPGFVDPFDGDFNLLDGSPCINNGTTADGPSEDMDGIARPQGSQTDIGVYEMPASYTPGPIVSYIPRRIYVSADGENDGDGLSWATAAPSLARAYWRSWQNDEFWVAKGEYHEYLIPEISTSYYGGFAGTETLLSERDYAANDSIINASGFKCTAVTGQDHVIIDGFTITGGNTGSGGGIRIYDTTPLIRNCKITGNRASSGGGIACAMSNAIITNCTITNNSASSGGGIYCSYLSPEFTNCVISNNSSDGVYSCECGPIISSCTLEHNKGNGLNICNSLPLLEDLLVNKNGGGIYFSCSKGEVNRCIICNNTSIYTDADQNCRTSDPVFKDCLFYNNSTNTWGGIYNITFGSNPSFINCTMVHNHATEGSGFSLFDSSLTLKNCILWNDGEEISDGTRNHPSVNISNTCIQGGFEGTGNINVEPLFQDPFNNDFHLKNGSPCINRGSATGVSAYDIEMNPRSQGSGVDMGAYEAPGDFVQGPVTYTPKRLFVRTGGDPLADGLSWLHATSSITQALRLAWWQDEIWVQQGRYHEAVILDASALIYGVK